MSLPPVILGNSNRRFSGVTSTLLATLPGVRERLEVTILGPHHLPPGTPHCTFRQLIKEGKDGQTRVFHARRNDEMIQALLARDVFGVPLKIIFTSTAQRYHSRFTRFLMGRMNHILTTCSAAGSYLRQPARRTIPHGVDLKKYHPSPDRESAWASLAYPGKYGIGIFGRVRPQKGTDLLVRAALKVLPKHPDFTLLIIGEITPSFQSFVAELKTEIEEAQLSDRIRFLGEQPADRLPELFRAMTLTVALSRNEGYGLTVLEAMASGSAVLASEAGAWKDIVIPGQTGEIVPCDDLLASTAALDQLLSSDLPTLDAFGQAGRQRAEEFYDIDQEAAALCQTYQDLL